ncbi:MAG: DNA starvation/stationary phase protection protein [Bryobacterales bacterium]|nr:DNA starvation/stationary phase protection protein [Bryobacterales bacterium]
MKANIGLSDEQRNGLVALLTVTLADEWVLYTKTRNYHWNVTGRHFNDLHKFFESQYEAMDGRIDEIAEFIRYTGAGVSASLAVFQQNARLKDEAGDPPEASRMIANLLADHEALIRSLREDIGTAGGKFQAADVADFLTGLLEDHDKMAWMLRSMLE